MRSALIGLVAVFMLAATGCNHHNLAKNGCSSCQGCGNGGCTAHGGRGGHGLAGYGHRGGCDGSCGGACGAGHGGGIAGHLGGPAPTPVGALPGGYLQDAGPTGPMGPSYAYPYYTTRAPRNFLMDNPPSIGY